MFAPPQCLPQVSVFVNVQSAPIPRSQPPPVLSMGRWSPVGYTVCIRNQGNTMSGSYSSSLVYAFHRNRVHFSSPPTSAQDPCDHASEQPGSEASLDVITSEFNFRSSQQIKTLGLVFARTPRIDEEPPPVPCMDRNELRLSPLALSQGPFENAAITTYEEWLISAKRSISNGDTAQSTSSPTKRIEASLEEEFRKLQFRKLSEWKRQQELARCKGSIGALKATILKPDHCTVVDTSESVAFTRAFPSPHGDFSSVSLSLLSYRAPRHLGVLCRCGNPSPAVWSLH